MNDMVIDEQSIKDTIYEFKNLTSQFVTLKENLNLWFAFFKFDKDSLGLLERLS